MEIAAPRLRALSQRKLTQQGLGAISPIEVNVDGKPLARAASGSLSDCAGESFFDKDRITFTAQDPATEPSHVSAIVSWDAPLWTEDGAVWWLYPKSTLEIDLPADPSLAGKQGELVITARSLGKQEPMITLQALGEETTTEAGAARLAVPLSGEGWQATVAVSHGGPYALLESMALLVDGKRWDLLAEATP